MGMLSLPRPGKKDGTLAQRARFRQWRDYERRSVILAKQRVWKQEKYTIYDKSGVALVSFAWLTEHVRSKIMTDREALLDGKFLKLVFSVLDGKSIRACHRRWRDFILTRDGFRCFLCDAQSKLHAHHIIRKTLYPIARFDTGNGITLCKACHQALHPKFNGRPNFYEPLDAQGGENIDWMMDLFGLLAEQALEDGPGYREFHYYLSEATVSFLKRSQGFTDSTEFPGLLVYQAYLILRQPSPHIMRELLEANGFSMPSMPFLPGVTVFQQ
ncbi:HNH endonuclease [Aerophototrophica crusticola]|uniref:HNH endonuclease n=1 Tax=Aerophototrophica crusticola TaxID=1709002 RepID=A0A858R661_9PROT|nr:HNH endonuclease [Rhodospirillaceae bacterium B3]